MTFKKLSQTGIGHIFLPLLIIVGFAIGGVYLVVSSHADSVVAQSTSSTYFFYPAGTQYSGISITSSGFPNSGCSSSAIGSSKPITFKMPKSVKDPVDGQLTHPPLALTCTTPATGESYTVNFLINGGIPDGQTAVGLDNTTNSCVFVHSNEAENAQGVTHILPRNNKGKCNASSDSDTPPNPAESKKKTTKPSVKKAAPAPKKATPAPKKATPTKKTTTTADSGKQTDDGLNLPPNFSTSAKDKFGYFLLPASPSNKDYYVHTASMPGGESTGSSPNSHRYGTKELIGLFYDVALQYKDKYKSTNSKLVIGDLDAPGHESHRNGIDMDVYTSDRTAALRSDKGGSDPRSVSLAEMFLRTKRVKFILFNDPQVRATVNTYAAANHLPGKMLQSNESHDYHFHVRVNRAPGPCTYGSAAQCSAAENLFAD